VELTQVSLLMAEQAGTKLSEMLPEIEKTSQLVQEIAAASAEQNNSVNQVNSSFQQLSSITQENASIAEEMASSSKELEHHAQEMRDMISYFKVNSYGKQLSDGGSGSVKPDDHRPDFSRAQSGAMAEAKAVVRPDDDGVDLDMDDKDFERF
jgi:methyl-accepting chemotaxis protein